MVAIGGCYEDKLSGLKGFGVRVRGKGSRKSLSFWLEHRVWGSGAVSWDRTTEGNLGAQGGGELCFGLFKVNVMRWPR